MTYAINNLKQTILDTQSVAEELHATRNLEVFDTY